VFVICVREVQLALLVCFCNWRCLCLARPLCAGLLEFTVRFISVSQLRVDTYRILHAILIKQNPYHRGKAILKISAEFPNQYNAVIGHYGVLYIVHVVWRVYV
jgi:hypothetical protein